MTYQFSAHSRAQLATLHPLLREILETAILTDDFRVDEGARSRDRQAQLVADGSSTTMESWHLPQADGFAYAADIWPYIHGRRLEVPAWAEIERRVLAGDAKRWIQDAVGAYAQFSWMMRRVKEVAQPILAAQANITGELWIVRFGLDWDGDGEILTDQVFDDFPHVELRRAA